MLQTGEDIQYRPVEAVILYERSERGFSTMGSSVKDYFKPEAPAFIANIHPFINGAICEGRPLTHEQIIDVCHKFLPNAVESVYLPEHVVSYTPGVKLIWWVPAGPRKIYFKKSSSLSTGTVPLPALLFRAQERGLDVWALKESKRPAMDADLYYPPFPNMLHPGHKVCTGNVKLPGIVTVNSIDAWEKGFFKSYFTTADAVSETYLKGIEWKKLWRELLAGQHERFPEQYLVKFGKIDKLFNQGGAQ